MKKVINTDNAPKAVGPYSQAVEASGLIFISGQLPIDPITGEFNSSLISEQTHQVLKNVSAILNSTGLNFDNVLKATVYLEDISDFASMNEVYAQYFNKPYPARAAFAVKSLPKGAKVEIEVIAAR